MDIVSMDALSRIEPVARPLLIRVDAALATLGAPPQHPVWAWLRALGATPADAVAYFARASGEPLRRSALALREQAAEYDQVSIPVDLAWAGAAGQSFRVHAIALAEHLNGASPESLAGRLRASALFLERAAAWFDHSRLRIARALSQVISSEQAVALRAGLIITGGAGPPVRDAPGAIVAAADIGAYVLAAAGDLLAEGRDLYVRGGGVLDEAVFAPASTLGQLPADSTLRLPD